jgi:hypothetical protein
MLKAVTSGVLGAKPSSGPNAFLRAMGTLLLKYASGGFIACGLAGDPL